MYTKYKEGNYMDNNDNIPRLVWERDQIRASHTIRMLIILIIFLMMVIVVIVGAFLFHLRDLHQAGGLLYDT